MIQKSLIMLFLDNAVILHDEPTINTAVLLHDGQFLTLMDRGEFQIQGKAGNAVVVFHDLPNFQDCAHAGFTEVVATAIEGDIWGEGGTHKMVYSRKFWH